MTGGEIAALAMLDATVRLIDGALPEESVRDESFVDTLLDHPAYTRPPTFRGVDVPEVLLSGRPREDRRMATRSLAGSHSRPASRSAISQACRLPARLPRRSPNGIIRELSASRPIFFTDLKSRT